MSTIVFATQTPSTVVLQSGGISTNTSFGSNGGAVTVIQNGPSIFTTLAEVLGVLAVLALVGLVMIVIVANRSDPDPTGRRPQSVYLFAVSFVTLVSSVIGSTIVVSALVQLSGPHQTLPGEGPHYIVDSVARTATLGGLITVLSLILFTVHLRRGLALVRAVTEPTSPILRVGQSYVSGVGFLAVLVLLVTGVLAAYLIFAIVGPGVFGSFGGRAPSLRDLIDALYVGVVASIILVTHRNLVPPRLRLLGHRRGAEGPSGRHVSRTDALASLPTDW